MSAFTRAAALAFPSANPDPGAVRAHIAKPHVGRPLASEASEGRHPVLWRTFKCDARVWWDRELTVVRPCAGCAVVHVPTDELCAQCAGLRPVEGGWGDYDVYHEGWD